MKLYKNEIGNSFACIDTQVKESEQPNAMPNAQADEQPTELANEHIITKLNLFFNYIINNIYNSDFRKITKFQGMKGNDRTAIRVILEQLGLYTDDMTGVLKLTDDKNLFILKLQYWLIHEIYFSPYRMFLGDLTAEQFIFRFKKVSEYIDFSNLNEFIKYFMRSIREEMEKGAKINDRKNN